jgi:RNA polymerase sigma-70 factor (ECF subfamily)
MDWDQAYRAHQADVFGYLYNRTGGDAELSRDLTQDVFVRAMHYEGRFTYDDGRGVGPWLTTIARNLLFDHFRSSQVRREIAHDDMHDLDGATASTEDQVLATLDCAGVLEAVARLLPEQREALVLHYWGRWSDAQIGRRLDRSADAVKMLKHRARRSLRRRLEAVA